MKREDLFITSKVNPAEQGRENCKVAVKGILSRLGLTYLDCVLIHWPGVSKLNPTDSKCAEIRLETWESLVDLRRDGLIRHIGVSNFEKIHLEHLFNHSKEKPEIN